MGNDMSKKGFGSVAIEQSLLPIEKPQRVGEKSMNLSIGIPKETSFQENRICLTPQAVNFLVNNGHHVVIESDSGKGAKFKDRQY